MLRNLARSLRHIHTSTMPVLNKTRKILNPATEEVIGTWTDTPLTEVDHLVQLARDAQPGWEKLGIDLRTEKLLSAMNKVVEKAEEIAKLLTLEIGRPMKHGKGLTSMAEVMGSLPYAKGICSIPIKMEKVTLEDDTQIVKEFLSPHGVVGIITPWNFPVLISVLFGLVPALRMGNTVVLKPSENATLVTSEVAKIISDELPENVIQIAKGADEVGKRVVEKCDYITFTGSVAAGRSVAKNAASRLIPSRCEMGGNDAAIILPNTDINKIADSVFAYATMNSGQTCIAIKRVYVHDDQYEDCVNALAERAENVPMGNGLEKGNVLGPLQNPEQLKVVETLVDDARSRGARIVTGGSKRDGPGYFYPVTIVADIPDDARLVVEEQFGTALPILPYSDLDDAIKRANSLNVGLGASVWGDEDEAAKVATKLEAGSVWVNRNADLNPFVPFSGWKNSGFGDGVGGEQGLRALTKTKIISCKKGSGDSEKLF